MQLWRKKVAFVGIAVTGLVLAGCTTTSSTKDSILGGKASVPTLESCSADVMRDTKASLNASVKAEMEANNVRSSSGIAIVNQPQPLLSITKASMLPCIPSIDVNNASVNPANVQAIQSVLDLDLWSKLVIANKIGAGNAGSPKMEGFSKPADSYKSFLTVAARFPYFCGENGDFATPQAACQQELSTMFAHAIQETGEKPVPPGEEVWQTSLYQTFEGACYVTKNCTDYDGNKEVFGAPADAQYYGRGMKQLSWAYNYAGFSASYYGDTKVLIDNPDLVGTHADLVLGSGIWFAMSPQNPKPSMHDVMLGYYKPKGPAAGITLEPSGSVSDRFSTTVSIINGAYECSPSTQTTKQQSINRYVNLKALLPQFGATPALQTTNEKQIVPGTTYCEIAAGNPFGNENLIYNPPAYYDTGGSPASCLLVGWQPVPVLSASAQGMAQFCHKNFGSGTSKPTTGPTSNPTTATPSQPSDWQMPLAQSKGLEVTFTSTGHWDTGYCVNTKATNNNAKAVAKWSYSFVLQSGQRVDGEPWSGALAATGNKYQADPAAQSIAPGQSVSTLGFCVSGSDAVPGELTLSVVNQ